MDLKFWQESRKIGINLFVCCQLTSSSRQVPGRRAVLQKGFLDFIKQENPDILCLQEVKAFEHQLPTEVRFAMQEYEYIWHRSERPGYA